MATNFPASLDTLTNPTSSDSLSSPSHSAQHANVNDAVEALQAKVGANSSAVTTSLDYKVAQLEAGATADAIKSYADSSARATAVPSPAEGDLSYLADVDSVEVYDGSAWTAVASGGSLVFITSTSASAVSSVSIDGCFTADYDNYLVVMKGTAAASATHELRLRFRASGSTETGNVYDNSILYLSTGGAASGVRFTAGLSTFSSVSTLYPTDGYAYIFRPFVSGATTGIIGQGAGTTGDSVHQNGNNTTSTTQYDGVNFFHATGGTFSANFYVYGVATS